MIKQWSKKFLVNVGKWISHNPSKRVVVLCYHSIHPAKPFASATPALFEQHLAWLKEHCDIIRFSQIHNSFRTRERQRPVIAITFDDGYVDNYEYAFTILRRFGVPATFFVTVGLLEKELAVIERFQNLRQCGYEDIRPLEWSQVREMRQAGMEFGTHTWSHPSLSRLDSRAAERELRHSKEIMEEHLDEPISLMAYPFGKPRRHFTWETVKLAKDIGYESAAAVLFRKVHITDLPFCIPRFFVTKDQLDMLKAKVLGAWDIVGLLQERTSLWLAKIISPDDFMV